MSITDETRELYMQYPFPNTDYKMDYGYQFLWFFSKVAPSGKKSFFEDIDVIEAGCGTGSTISHLASQFPSSRFTGLDMTTNSLNVARKNAEARGIKNLQFVEDNILEMNLGKKFDVVLNIGVLHHLADMDVGLKRLTEHVKDDGYLVLWLYGRYGRARLNWNQRMFRILLQNVDTLPEKVQLAKQALSTFPEEMTTCHFNTPTSKIEDNYQEALKYAFENESWLVDQFLHVNEKVVSMDDVLELCGNHNLDIVKFFGFKTDMRDFTKEQAVIDQFDRLSYEDKLLVCDLLQKPNYYFLVAKKKAKAV